MPAHKQQIEICVRGIQECRNSERLPGPNVAVAKMACISAGTFAGLWHSKALVQDVARFLVTYRIPAGVWVRIRLLFDQNKSARKHKSV